MKLWLLVPVKPFEIAKSRLSAILTPTDRAQIARELLVQTLRLGRTSDLFAAMLVISRSEEVLAVAELEQAHALHEEGEGLNSAIAQGIAYAEGAGAEGVLVLPADLPLMTRTDLLEITDLIEEVDVVVVASVDGGTNALCQRLPAPIAPAFGTESFSRHLAEAQAARCRVAILSSPTVAFDLDSPENWRMLFESSVQGGADRIG